VSKRKEHWENIYKTKDHLQVGWYQESPTISLELLSRNNSTPADSIIDVGCGASVLVDNLISKGYTKITLLDLSEEALLSISSRLGDKGSIPQYLSKDITKHIDFKKSFDVWHDRAVFHFLTNANDRKAYMENLEKNLSPSGYAIIGTFSLNGPSKCSGLDVVQYNEEKMSLELPQGFEVSDTVISTHIMPSGSRQEYIYFIINRKND